MAAPILLMLPRLCVVGRFFIFERTTARSLRRRRSLSRRERISGRAGADAKKERRLGVGCEGAFRCLPRCGVVADTADTTPDVRRAFQCKNKRGDARVEHLPSSHTGQRPRWRQRQVIYKTCTACAQFNFDFATAHQSIAGRARFGVQCAHTWTRRRIFVSLVRYLEALQRRSRRPCSNGSARPELLAKSSASRQTLVLCWTKSDQPKSRRLSTTISRMSPATLASSTNGSMPSSPWAPG